MSSSGATQLKERGIQYWMERALVECASARNGFAADPVHDLRVALRRCRSLADGVRAVDPDPRWRAMRSAAKSVFRALGELRDVQVLAEWVEKLSQEGDPVRQRLLEHCAAREAELKTLAAAALDAFDETQWREWSVALEQRAEAVAEHGEIFRVLALEKWLDAWQLHREALRNRSKTGYHALRIGVKRFRYLVENFLPEEHERWGKELKRIQDLLGEVHDFDVLLDTARAIHAFADEEEHARWRALLERERDERLAVYRKKMIGRGSLWREWRAGLPRGKALASGIQSRFATWAGFLDPDVAHTRRVLRLSLKVHDALHEAALLRATEYRGVPARELLAVAALVREVGRARGTRGHHKRAQRMLERLEPPPGWTPEHLRVAGLIARYHRGALPAERHLPYRRLPARARALVSALAGVLRLADALAETTTVRMFHVEQTVPWIRLRAGGYDPQMAGAEQVAAARHLLETAVGRPVVITSTVR
ncbi:MAG TPA: CHAD domain-containing protein [Terriglobales bacterium]|nr:CHAD domain-containing protein [Terriglobales bacterium]